MKKNTGLIIFNIITIIISILIDVILFQHKIYDYLIVSIILSIVLLILLLILIKRRRMNNKDKYLSSLKRILKVYNPIMVKATNLPNIVDKQVIYVNSINDLVKAQLEVKKPIFYISGSIETTFYLIENEYIVIYILGVLEDKITKIDEEKEVNIIDDKNETIVIEEENEENIISREQLELI